MATTVWKGHLTFGLVSIPIRLFRAARAEKVSFHQLYRQSSGGRSEREPDEEESNGDNRQASYQSGREQAAALGPQRIAARGPEAVPPLRSSAEPETEPELLTRVRQSAYAPQVDDEDEAKPVARRDLVKGFEYAKDQYVVIGDEELKKLTPKTATEMQILEFVRFQEIDPVYLETSYYVSAEEAGNKAYALLFQAMRQSGYAALATVAMHRREHVAILRPGQRGIVLHTMFYLDEVRKEQEYPADTDLVTDKELKLATMLVETLAAPFEPGKYKDTYREQVQQLIEAKVQGKTVAQTSPVKKQAAVIDIMQALEKSLAQAKKPAAAPVEGDRRPATKAANPKRTSAKRAAH